MKKYKFLILSLIFLALFVGSIYLVINYGWNFVFNAVNQQKASPLTFVLALSLNIALGLASFIFAILSLIRKEGKIVYLLGVPIMLILLWSLFKFLT